MLEITLLLGGKFMVLIDMIDTFESERIRKLS